LANSECDSVKFEIRSKGEQKALIELDLRKSELKIKDLTPGFPEIKNKDLTPGFLNVKLI